jgi:hypothetical protein
MRLTNVEIKVIYLLQKMEFYQLHMDNAIFVNKPEYDRLNHFYERTYREYLELIKDWPEHRVNKINNLIK